MSIKRTGFYWRRVVARAWSDTWAASPINSFFKIALWLATPLAWAIVGLSSRQLPPDVFWIGLQVYASIFLLVVVLKLLSLPSTLRAEDLSKLEGERDTLIAERDDAVARLSAKAARDERYDYALSVHVDVTSDVFGQNPIPMRCHLKLANRGQVPIEYKNIDIERQFDGCVVQSSIGQGAILRPGEVTTYTYNVDPSRWVSNGVLNVTVIARYGQPHGRPSRHLSKVMRVQYQYMSALTDSTCHTVTELEVDIPDQLLN